MKSYAFEVRGTIKVDNTDWPLGAHIVVEAETLAELRGRLDAAIQGLYAMGLRPETQVVSPPHAAESNKPSGPPRGYETPKPRCQEHDVDMVLSKYQNKRDVTVWYCPDQTDGRYCLSRCNVHNNSGHQEFYKVRGR